MYAPGWSDLTIRTLGASCERVVTRAIPGHDSEVLGPYGANRGPDPSSRGAPVPLFVIERNFVEDLDLGSLDRDGIRLVNDEVGVQWVYSFLSADKKKTYCLYEAPNPEAIREAAARLGIPADVIVAVEQFGPIPA
jgi:hypothetical protein